MQRTLLLTTEPIDEVGLIRSRPAATTCGAALVFNGIVRGEESGAAIAGLDYEAFERMAIHQFERLFDELESAGPGWSPFVSSTGPDRSPPERPASGWRSDHPTAPRPSPPASG